MANTTPFISGQLNRVASTASDDVALFLKEFSGEVFRTFAEKNIFKELVYSKNVGTGKSHQFLVLGQAQGGYHAKGVDMMDPANGLLNSFEQGERLIQVDRPFVAPFFTDDWDQKLAHFQTRAPYADECGIALANHLDRRIAQVIALAAAAPATLSATQSATKAGEQITAANVGTDPSVMIDAIIDAATVVAEKDVPMDQMVCAVRPAMFYKLVKEGSLINRDFNDANGSRAKGFFSEAYGFRVVWSNHIPSTNISQVAGQYNTYAGDFTDLQALVWHPSAVGTIYQDMISVETERKATHGGDFIVAKMTTGTGILRPECAISISNA